MVCVWLKTHLFVPGSSRLKPWRLGPDKMFSNQASPETTGDKSPVLLLFSRHLSSGPLSFSLLYHYFTLYSFLTIHSPWLFFSLLFCPRSNMQYLLQLHLPCSHFLCTSLYLSFSHSFLIWRPLLSLIHHQSYSKDVCININRWALFFAFTFFLYAPHFPISAYILISSLSSMFCMRG